MNDFDRAVAVILQFEGGFSEDKSDPGGTTNYGISQRAHPSIDIRNLTIDQAKAIYRKDYWLPLDCDSHGWPFNLCLFDTGVQRGVQTAKNMAEAAGWKTETLLLDRMAHYIKRVAQDPTQQKFLKGWFNRLNSLWSIARNGV